MKTRIIGLMVAVGFAVGFAAACETGQPPASCPTPHTSIFTVYQVAEADAAKDCGGLTGEFWALGKYNEPGTTESQLAVKPDQMGNFYDPEQPAEFNRNLSAIGNFDFQANEEGFCSATDLSPATVSVPADGVDITYNITRMELVGTAQVPGTQFRGEFDYTENGCTAHYTFVGVAPWVPCEELDEAGDPVLDADGNPIPDDTRCNSSTLPDGGLGVACNDFGECLNPDFAMKCDPVNLVCTPAGEIPSLKE